MQERNNAAFIVFEGIDGAGKTTAIKTLTDYLNGNKNRKYVQTREPGGTRLNEYIRNAILSNKEEPTDLVTEALLMLGMRYHHVHTAILPNLQQDMDVVCSRFNDSTRVYQGLLGGSRGCNFLQDIAQATQMKFFRERPDITVFLTASNDASAARIRRRGELDALDEKFTNPNLDVALAWENHVHEVIHSREVMFGSRQIIVIDTEKSLEKIQEELIERIEHAFTVHRERPPHVLSFLESMMKN